MRVMPEREPNAPPRASRGPKGSLLLSASRICELTEQKRNAEPGRWYALGVPQHPIASSGHPKPARHTLPIRNRSSSLKTKGRHPHYLTQNQGLSICRSSPIGPQYPLPRSSPPSSNRQSCRLEIRGGIRKKGVGASPNRQASCHSSRSPTDLAIPGLAYCASRFSSFKFRLSRLGCLSIVSSRIAAKIHTISSLGSSAHHNSKAGTP
jgi:hypothetical protein